MSSLIYNTGQELIDRCLASCTDCHRPMTVKNGETFTRISEYKGGEQISEEFLCPSCSRKRLNPADRL